MNEFYQEKRLFFLPPSYSGRCVNDPSFAHCTQKRFIVFNCLEKAAVPRHIVKQERRI